MSRYNYEDLGPERFQEFCQALLIKQFPRLQCLPVAMQDGGRDAVVSNNANDALIFQIKFRRPTPLANATHQDFLKWLQNAIIPELSKIDSLIKRGAQRYVIISNVPCSSHPDTGTRDLMLEWLRDRISVEIDVWWRSDLDRRLEPERELKRTYGLIDSDSTHSDMFDTLLAGYQETISGVVRTSRTDTRLVAIKKFLRNQYQRDSHIKFKQAELPTHPLLRTYLDIRAVFEFPASGSRRRNSSHQIIVNRVARWTGEQHGIAFPHQAGGYSRQLPAAGILLLSGGNNGFKNVVIEGAPGQGKSTLAQYICQIHRARLLHEIDALNDVPPWYRASPIILPFRVDLRDLAMWFQSRNPFSAQLDEVPENWIESIEGFLAAMVSTAAGGASFTVSDLDSVLTATPTLLVFDGLDEVADIEERQNIVNHIESCVERLNEISPELRVVVTSRPAAFSTAPKFNAEQYAYMTLTDLSETLIKEYANTWVKARGIEKGEAAEIKTTLSEKLHEPHIAELARNAMQLAILLWLIYQQGKSLPEQRTALYREYINTFLNREAEKSEIIRKHRNIVTGLHGYLAWILHARAERGRSQGNVSEDELKTLLRRYLDDWGHREVVVVDQLFQGMVERVVALVSRVEGTYEFEVQPLREYFAAYYLYDTARYSPPGAHVAGTKADRFNALSRNSYWHNVVRFYVGFFDKGELSHLLYQFDELFMHGDQSLLTYPRILAKNLISDHVFVDSPKLGRKLAEQIAAAPIGWFALTREPMESTLRLPKDSGGIEVIKAAKQHLTDDRVPHTPLVASVLGDLAEKKELIGWWKDNLPTRSSRDWHYWMRLGVQLDLLTHLDNQEASEVFDTPHCSVLDFRYIFSGGLTRLGIQSEAHAANMIEYLKLGVNRDLSVSQTPNIFDLAALALSDLIFEIAAAGDFDDNIDSAILAAKDSPHLEGLKTFVERAFELARSTRRRRRSGAIQSVGDGLSKLIEETLGRCWSMVLPGAALHHRMRPARDLDIDSAGVDLSDWGESLSSRILAARANFDNIPWWIDQCGAADGDVLSVQLVTSLVAAFGSERVISACSSTLSDSVEALPVEHSASMLATFYWFEATSTPRLNLSQIDLEAVSSPIFLSIIAMRVRRDQQPKALAKALESIDRPIIRDQVGSLLMQSCLERVIGAGRWFGTKSLFFRHIKTLPLAGAVAPFSGLFSSRTVRQKLDRSVAREILKSVDEFPPRLVLVANEVLTDDVAVTTPAIAEVAISESWFDREQPL